MKKQNSNLDFLPSKTQFRLLVSRNVKRINSWSSSQDEDMGRNAFKLLPCATKTKITTNLKTKNNQNCQKIKLHRSPTNKELKEHASRLVGGVGMGSQGREDMWQGSR